jgi:hypothetical protein
LSEAGGGKRKHRATGRPKTGGKREGAGRPEGSTNALPLGAIEALKVGAMRVPEGSSAEAKELASLAFQRMVDVMMERVSSFHAANVLKSSTQVRHEICGPLAQRMEHTGKDGDSLQIVVKTLADGGED